MRYKCPYCKRPVIMHDKAGVVDGPGVRPNVPRWCSGICDSLMGLFSIYEVMIERGNIKGAQKVMKDIKREAVEALVERDKDNRER